MCKISVVMPVYNTPIEYLNMAINSILNQTYSDFEFLIINDGSNKETVDFLNTLDDKRIRIISNNKNLGIAKSLNIGIKESKGKYIARMDADDISLPNRFKEQVKYMKLHPDVIACGTNIRIISNNSAINNKELYYEDMDVNTFRSKLLFYNCGPAHPSVFFNKELLLKHQIKYNERFIVEDYKMWVDCSKYGKIGAINKVLLEYRDHDSRISKTKINRIKEDFKKIQREQLERLFENANNINEDLNKVLTNEVDDVDKIIYWLIFY